MDIKEEWKPVPGYNSYLVSNLGNVRSINRVIYDKNGHCSKKAGKFIKQQLRKRKYPMVCLHKEGASRNYFVHRLMLLAFVGPIPFGQETRHLDGNGSNNNLGNICYGTKHENMNDQKRHGTFVYGSKNGKSKTTERDVLLIRKYFYDGAARKDIATHFSISIRRVHSICGCQNWNWLSSSTTPPLIKKVKNKLTQRDVLLIRKYLKDGQNTVEIARHFGVGRSCISLIKNGKNWKED